MSSFPYFVATLSLLSTLSAAPLAFGGTPVSKAQLLDLAKQKVDSKLIMRLIENDCVDFDVDATNLAE